MPEKLNFGPKPAALRESALRRHLVAHNNLLATAAEMGLFADAQAQDQETVRLLEEHSAGLREDAAAAINSIRGYIHLMERERDAEDQEIPDAAATKIGWNAVARLRVIYTDLMEKYRFAGEQEEELRINVTDLTTRAFHAWLDQYQDEEDLGVLVSGEIFDNDQGFDGAVTSLVMALDNMPTEQITALLEHGDVNVSRALFCGLIVRIATDQNLHSQVTENLPEQYRGMRSRVADKLLDILDRDYVLENVKNNFDKVCRNPQKQTDSKYFYIADIVNSEEEEVAANRLDLQKVLGLEDRDGKIFIPAPSNPQDQKDCDDRIVTLLEIIYKQPKRLSSENVRELLTARNGDIFKQALKMVSSGKNPGLLSALNISATGNDNKFKEFLDKLVAAVAVAYESTEWQPVLLEALDKVELKKDSMHNAQLEDLRSKILGQISNAQLILTKENLIKVLAKADGANQITKLVNCMTDAEATGPRQQLTALYPTFKSKLEDSDPSMDNLSLIQNTLVSGLEDAGFPSADSREQRRNNAIMQTLSTVARHYIESDEPAHQNFSNSLMAIHKQAVETMQGQTSYYLQLLTPDLALKYGFISDKIPTLADDALWRILTHCTAGSRKPKSPELIRNWTKDVTATADAFPELLRNGDLAGAHKLTEVAQAKNVERILLDVKRALSNSQYTQEQKDNLEARVIKAHRAAKALAQHAGRQEGMSIISQAIERYFPSTLARESEIMEKTKERQEGAAKKIPAEQVTAPVKVDPQKDPKGVKSVNPVATKTTPAPSTQKKPDPQAKPKETEVKEKVVTATTATKQTKPATTATTAVEEKQPWYKRYQSTLGYSALFVLAVITTPLLCTFVAPLAAGAAFWAVAIIGGVLGLVGLGGAIYSGYQTWQEDKAQEASQALKKAPEAPAIEAKKDATQSPGTDVSNTSSAAPIAPQPQTVAVGA